MSPALKWIFTLSLVLNLLLAGIIAGQAGRCLFTHSPYRHQREALETLPEDKRQLLKDALNQAERDTGELHEQLSDAGKQASRMLEAEQFDKDAYLAQARHMQALRLQIMRRMSEAVAEVAAQLTPQERAALVRMLHRPPERPLSERLFGRQPPRPPEER
ncbi:MAG: periplasmic heavy metal sensor [Alphaproteobacteria bacterium]|nr:periplasmic heavy metal sensor [Alphaproteobacteria bacterium]